MSKEEWEEAFQDWEINEVEEINYSWYSSANQGWMAACEYMQSQEEEIDHELDKAAAVAECATLLMGSILKLAVCVEALNGVMEDGLHLHERTYLKVEETLTKVKE